MFRLIENPPTSPLPENPILLAKNAGGTSKISEAVSYDILKGASLPSRVYTELEVAYKAEVSGVAHVDFVFVVDGVHMIVSVTRVTKYSRFINDARYRTSTMSVTECLLHKFEGFGNVAYPQPQQHILFIWTEESEMEKLVSAINAVQPQNPACGIFVAKTNSAAIMYERPEMISVDRYYSLVAERSEARLAALLAIRQAKSKRKQEKVLCEILRATRVAFRRIISNNRRKTIKESGQATFLLHKWIFKETGMGRNDLFRSYYIGNLVNVERYTAQMKYIESRKYSLIELLEEYYNKKSQWAKVEYVKDKEFNPEENKINLTGALILRTNYVCPEN
jgi:hypothetical protein